jgi:Zn-dependent protease with chaperone function
MRADPLAFATDTSLRFSLLLVAALATTFFAYAQLWDALPSQVVGDYHTRLAACGQLTLPTSAEIAASRVDPDFAPTTTCRWQIKTERTSVVLLGTTAVLSFALLLYFLAPVRRIRRDGLVALKMPDSMAAAVTPLVAAASLRARPTFVWNPNDRSTRAAAFGHIRRRYVVVGAGLVMSALLHDSRRFRALIRHELAHLRHGDVDLTFGATALWQSVFVLALTPVIVWVVAIGLDPLQILWRVVVAGGLVWVLRNAVLRSRESYADLRAGREDLEGMREALLAQKEVRDRGGFGGLLRVHPTREDRLQNLADSDRLLGVDWWVVLAAGLAAGLAQPGIASLARLLIADPAVARFTIHLSVMLLAFGVVSVSVWRGAARAVTGRPSTLRPLRVAVAFVSGLTLGGIVGIDSLTETTLREGRFPGVVLAAGAKTVAAVLLCGLVALLLLWLDRTGRLWLAAHGSARAARTGVFVAATVAAVVLALFRYWLDSYTVAADLVAGTGSGPDLLIGMTFLGWTVLLLPTLVGVPGLIAIAALLIVPFFTQLGTRGAGMAAPWRHGPPGAIESPAGLVRLRAGAAGRMGLRATIAYAATYFALPLLVGRLIPRPEVWATEGFQMTQGFAGIAAGFALLVAATVFGASLDVNFRSLHGVLAGCVAGIGITCVYLLAPSLLGGSLPSVQESMTHFAIVLVGGGVLSLPFAVLASRGVPASPRGRVLAVPLGSALLVSVVVAGVSLVAAPAGASGSAGSVVSTTGLPSPTVTPSHATYRRVVDDTGTLSVDVPADWTDVSTKPRVGTGFQVKWIQAAPDRGSFADGANSGLDVEVYMVEERVELTDFLEIRTRGAKASCGISQGPTIVHDDLAFWLLASCGPNRVVHQYYALRPDNHPEAIVSILILLTRDSGQYVEMHRRVLDSLTLLP